MKKFDKTDSSPFQLVGSKIVNDLRMPAIPIHPKGKYPAKYINGKWSGLAWKKYQTKLPTPAEIEQWDSYPSANVGIVLGEISGIIALDFDNHPQLHEIILNEMGDSILTKKGKKGFTKFYRYNGEKSKKWHFNRETVLELLSNGCQTVIPPSVHPETLGPYSWLGESILEADILELDSLPENFIERINSIFGYKELNEFIKEDHSIYDEDDLIAALEFIPSDDYILWIHIGMALYGIKRFDLWDAWSRKSSKFVEGDTKKKWPTFKGGEEGKKRTIKSIFWEARKRGYRKEKFRAEFNSENVSSEVSDEEKNFIPDKLALSAPGLVGEITRDIVRTAIYPQPALALAAALPFVGALKANKVQGHTGLMTNIYTLGLSPSGTGKNHPIQYIKKLCNSVGIFDLISGKPSSGVAVLSCLKKNNSRQLMVHDEFGEMLKVITRSRSDGFMKEVLTALMELFSSASDWYHGKTYANHDGSKPPINIEKPNLSLLAVSTPGSYYDALSSEYAVNGLIPRLLVFKPEKPNQKRIRDVGIIEIDPKIIEKVTLIHEQEISFGNLKNNTKIIKLEEALLDSFNDMWDAFDDLKNSENHEGKRAIRARALEHTLKVALICEDSDQLTERVLNWSKSLVEASIDCLMNDLDERLADNKQQSFKQMLTRKIKEAGKNGITSSDLTRKTQNIDGRDRKHMLDDLEEAGIIYKTVINQGGGPGAKGSRYFFHKYSKGKN